MLSIGDEYVRGLDIAMDDARGMRGIQTVGDFDRERKEIFDRRETPTGPADNVVLQGSSIQELHDDESAARVLADVVNGADVRMIQGGSGAGFAPETVQSVRVASQIRPTKI